MTTLIGTTVEYRRIAELRPHPENQRIYKDTPDAAFVESIRTQGVQNPLLITADGVIIGGNRRWSACKEIGHETVPVLIFNKTSDLDILEALVENNRQRQKTTEEQAREYHILKKVYHDRCSLQGSNQHKQKELEEGASISRETKAPPSVMAAEKVGGAKATLERAAVVVEKIDQLRAKGKFQEATELSNKLNKNVTKTYNEVRPPTKRKCKKPARATSAASDPAGEPTSPVTDPCDPGTDQPGTLVEQVRALANAIRLAEEQSTELFSGQLGNLTASEHDQTLMDLDYLAWFCREILIMHPPRAGQHQGRPDVVDQPRRNQVRLSQGSVDSANSDNPLQAQPQCSNRDSQPEYDACRIVRLRELAANALEDPEQSGVLADFLRNELRRFEEAERVRSHPRSLCTILLVLNRNENTRLDYHDLCTSFQLVTSDQLNQIVNETYSAYSPKKQTLVRLVRRAIIARLRNEVLTRDMLELWRQEEEQRLRQERRAKRSAPVRVAG